MEKSTVPTGQTRQIARKYVRRTASNAETAIASTNNGDATVKTTAKTVPTKKTAFRPHVRRADSNAKITAASHAPPYATATTNAKTAATKTNTYANVTDCARTINSPVKTAIALAACCDATDSTIAAIIATKLTAKLRRANGTRALKFASKPKKASRPVNASKATSSSTEELANLGVNPMPNW